MPITKFRRAPGQLTVLTVLGFVTGLLALVALAQQADAQKGGEIERPQIEIRPAPPDLEVAVTVPAQIAYTGQGMVQVRVDNTLLIKPSAIPGAPGYLAGSAANGVLVRVMFSRLEPLTVKAAAVCSAC